MTIATDKNESFFGVVQGAFESIYGHAPFGVVRAPGRINLIGEHTDYNDGFVLPMAINRAVWIAFEPRADGRVEVRSLDFQEDAGFSLGSLRRQTRNWIEYIKGVAWAMQEAGHTLRGWQGVVAGNVPIGAGLSSSAALELATARTFAEVSCISWHPESMARIGQRAENEWIGVRCGIMDQLASAAGKKGHALLLDCRSLQYDQTPLPRGVSVVVLDTMTRRGLVDSAYNERRSQCEAAARLFGVRALRDVSMAQFAAQADQLDEVIRRRARHVVTENYRTLQAAEVMRKGEAIRLGELMNDSHESLRHDFEVSSRELDLMVACGRRHNACLGIRMTGAGFGGCAVALVENAGVDAFAAAVAKDYLSVIGLTPDITVCTATDGASVVSG